MPTFILPNRLNLSAKEYFDQVAYQDIFNNGEKIYLDFKEVTSVDSSGLGALLLVKAKAKEWNIEIFVINQNSDVKDIFALAHFDKLFNIMT